MTAARLYPSPPGNFLAVLYSVLLHAAVITLLAVSFHWTMNSSSPHIIQATIVTEAPQRAQEEANRRAQEEEAARRQKAETEKRRQEEIRKQQEEEQKRLAAEQKKREAAEKARQKRAAEVSRKKEMQQRRKQAELSLQEQLAAEETERREADRAARAATVVDKYRALIRSQVSRSWNRPLGTARGLKCVVRVRLTPRGEVLNAAVVRSSGDAVFDRSVENAVYKAAPLPLPEDPLLFDNFREIEFLFSPEQ